MRESSSTKRLVEYLKKNLAKGYTLDSLKWALINQGYSRTEIFKAIEVANKELAESAPKLKEKPKITYEVVNENNQPIAIKKPWWKIIFGLD